MAGVVVKENESLDEALRRFKRELLEEGIIDEVHRRLYYEKPSERRKRLKKSRKKRR